MKTQQQHLEDLVAALIARLKPLAAKQGDLTQLLTTNKSNIVGAINELFALIGTNSGSFINDSASSGTNETYSIDKVLSLISGLRDEIMGDDVSAAMNSFKEIQEALAADESVTSALVTAMAKRVSVSAPQTFTIEEKIQGRANIGAYGIDEIGDPHTDLAALFNAAMDS